MADELADLIAGARLHVERVLLGRFSAGYGFSDGRVPAEVYVADADARARIGRDPLRPRNTHAEQLAEVERRIAAMPAWPAPDTRLARLASRFGLDAVDASLIGIAAAYAIDRDVGALCHALAAPRRAGLWGDVLAEVAGVSRASAALGPGGAVVRSLLVAPVGGDDSGRPVLGAAFACAPRVVAWLAGDELPWPDGIELIDAGDAPVFLDERGAADLDAAIASLARASTGLSVLIHGPEGAGKRAVARRIATALGRPLLAAPLPELLGAAEVVAVREALSWARLHGAIAYLPGLDAVEPRHERALGAALAAHPDPVVVASRDPSAMSIPGHVPFVAVRLPRPTFDLRTRAWRHALDGTPLAGDAAAFAARHILGPGTIDQVVHDARTFARATGATLGNAEVEAAVRRRLTLRLGAFGALVARQAAFGDMVIPDEVESSLRDIIAMVKERATILERWGYARHLGLSRGVSALFTGSPGTGKTMAASVIASELGLPLFRIDLASVVSKWVGETEKHLAKIFDEAQSAQALLLFDEADSLFGKRTEVKSSNDRYANLEVNYLLQRMETFDGISILTSNLESAIDKAFLRRLNFRVRFPDPDLGERALLWQRLVPVEAEVAPDVDFDALARRFEMSGGHIRNAIVRAAVLAARRGGRIQPDDLVEGAQHEYSELGKVMTDRTRPSGLS
ncbi:MAG TPA: AAA family ATPase [Kofleriaceae bacterium]|nr:AAA family ATPase [Kofleriaceae bacterium]